MGDFSAESGQTASGIETHQGAAVSENSEAVAEKRAIVVPGVARFATAPRLQEAPQLESISSISAREKKALPAFKEYGGAAPPPSAATEEKAAATPVAARASSPDKASSELPLPRVAPPAPAVAQDAVRAGAESTSLGVKPATQVVAQDAVQAGAEAASLGVKPAAQAVAQDAVQAGAGSASLGGDKRTTPTFSNKNKGKYDEELPFQYYSPPMYERIKADLQRGKVWARMQSVRLYRVIEGDDELQTALVGRTLAKEREAIKQFRTIGWVLCALNAVACVFVLGAFSVFILAFLGWLFSFEYKQARRDCKDKGIFLWGAVLAVILGFIFKGHILMQAYAAFTVGVMLWPFLMFQKMHTYCLNLFLSDYNFFCYATGRPKGSPDRPAIVLVTPSEKAALGTINWDINPNPELTDLQIDSPYPTLIGRSYDFYFSKFQTRLFSFIVALALGFGNVENLFPTALGCALGFSVLYSFVCPSQQFVEFRCSRNAYGNEGDRLPTYFLWMGINVVWTTVCLFAMSWLIQHFWPIARPQVVSQLDDSFPRWRPVLQSILDLVGIKVKLVIG